MKVSRLRDYCIHRPADQLPVLLGWGRVCRLQQRNTPNGHPTRSFVFPPVADATPLLCLNVACCGSPASHNHSLLTCFYVPEYGHATHETTIRAACRRGAGRWR